MMGSAANSTARIAPSKTGVVGPMARASVEDGVFEEHEDDDNNESSIPSFADMELSAGTDALHDACPIFPAISPTCSPLL